MNTKKQIKRKLSNTDYLLVVEVGAGVTINPIAFLIITTDNVRLIPVNHSSSLDRLIDYIPDLIEKTNQMMNRCIQNKKEATEKIITEISKKNKKASNTTTKEEKNDTKEEILEEEEDEELEEIVKEQTDESNAEDVESELKKLEHKKDLSTRDNKQTTMISIDKLENYPNQPFKEYTEEKELEMIDSIKVNGIIQDLIVRPLPNGNYQILSGHNRKNCAIKAGLTELPCKIKDVDDDMAKLMLVDTNLIQRKELYPSETAKALKIKKDIYKKKDVKSDFFDEISKEQNMSRGNIQRYLRLNYLVPELLERVDNKSMSIKIAEDLSFLSEKEQEILNNTIEARGFKINTNQAKMLREESSNNNLTEENLTNILVNSEKGLKNDIELKFTKKEVEKYFNDFDNVAEIKDFIVSILEDLISSPKEAMDNG